METADVQGWRVATWGQANQLCARGAVIIDFYTACLSHYQTVSPDRLGAVAAEVSKLVPELGAVEGERTPGKKLTDYAVRQAEAAVRAAALNFYHLAVEETVHSCLRMGAILKTATVMEWQKDKQIRLSDVETKTRSQLERQVVETWLKETLSKSLPKKAGLLNALLPPRGETVIDLKFVEDLDEARHDSIHRGGAKEAAAFNLPVGRAVAFGTCTSLIDRVLDAALPEGWRDHEDAKRTGA